MCVCLMPAMLLGYKSGISGECFNPNPLSKIGHASSTNELQMSTLSSLLAQWRNVQILLRTDSPRKTLKSASQAMRSTSSRSPLLNSSVPSYIITDSHLFFIYSPPTGGCSLHAPRCRLSSLNRLFWPLYSWISLWTVRRMKKGWVRKWLRWVKRNVEKNLLPSTSVAFIVYWVVTDFYLHILQKRG